MRFIRIKNKRVKDKTINLNRLNIINSSKFIIYIT